MNLGGHCCSKTSHQSFRDDADIAEISRVIHPYYAIKIKMNQPWEIEQLGHCADVEASKKSRQSSIIWYHDSMKWKLRFWERRSIESVQSTFLLFVCYILPSFIAKANLIR